MEIKLTRKKGHVKCETRWGTTIKLVYPKEWNVTEYAEYLSTATMDYVMLTFEKAHHVPEVYYIDKNDKGKLSGYSSFDEDMTKFKNALEVKIEGE